MNARRVLYSSAAVLVIAVGTNAAFGSTAGSAPGDVPIVNCASMPELWSSATEIGYRADTNRVTFVWPVLGDVAGTPLTVTVELPADDLGCDTQPGLTQFMHDVVQADQETALQSCLDLKALVSILRAANPDATGEVPVPADADAQVLSVRHPEQLLGAEGEQFRASLLERNQHVPRTLDLGQADAEIAAGCAS